MVKKSQTIPIFIVIFFDMLGFGMIIPVIRDFTEYLVNLSNYNTNNYATYAGILMASYSFFQFIFAPILGRFSDIYGRKLILSVSVLGNILSYLLWAVSNNFLFFLISRVISGATGANISVAQSYIADITSKSERAKYMGLMGAVFGIGFILGPVFGGLLSLIDLSDLSTGWLKFNQFSMIGIATASLSIINLLWIQRKIPETIKNGRLLAEIGNNPMIKSDHPPSPRPIYAMARIRDLKNKKLLLIVFAFFMMSLGFVHVEATLAWDLKDRFGLNTSQTGYYFGFMGIIMALVQGGLYRYLLTKYNLAVLAKWGALILCVGLILMPISYPLTIAGVTTCILALGMGIGNPSMLTLASHYSNESDQGVNLGIMQSAGALARIIAPITATLAYDNVHNSSPYIAASGLLLVCFWVLSNKQLK